MPIPGLDRINLKILDALQQDARISNVALAEQVALSPSPCLRRVRQLHEQGVIQSVLTVVSPRAVGYQIQALIEVKIAQHGEDESAAFENAVRAMPEILACYLVSGTKDYVLQAVSRDVSAYSRLVKRIGGLPGIREIQSNIVLETVKPWSALPLGAMLDVDLPDD